MKICYLYVIIIHLILNGYSTIYESCIVVLMFAGMYIFGTGRLAGPVADRSGCTCAHKTSAYSLTVLSTANTITEQHRGNVELGTHAQCK